MTKDVETDTPQEAQATRVVIEMTHSPEEEMILPVMIGAVTMYLETEALAMKEESPRGRDPSLKCLR